jgi:hypothetical protein
MMLTRIMSHPFRRELARNRKGDMKASPGNVMARIQTKRRENGADGMKA